MDGYNYVVDINNKAIHKARNFIFYRRFIIHNEILCVFYYIVCLNIYFHLNPMYPIQLSYKKYTYNLNRYL